MTDTPADVALRSGILRAERQAEELETARDVFEQALEAADGGREG